MKWWMNGRVIVATLLPMLVFPGQVGIDFSEQNGNNRLREFPGMETAMLPQSPAFFLPQQPPPMRARPIVTLPTVISTATALPPPQKIPAALAPAPGPLHRAPFPAVITFSKPVPEKAPPIVISRREPKPKPKPQVRPSAPAAPPAHLEKVRSSVNAIESRADEEKYKAYKAFLDEQARRDALPKNISESEFLRRGVDDYVSALQKYSLKAEKRRLELIRFVRKTFSAMDAPPTDRSLIGPLFSSFLRVASPQGSYQLLTFWHRQMESAPVYDGSHSAPICLFLRRNRTEAGLPLSYKTPPGYWKSIKSPMTRVDSVLERVLVAYTVNIYDAAVWQIALMAAEPSPPAMVDDETVRLLSGSSGQLHDIRAYGKIFKYGDRRVEMKRDNGYFFRIIADEYIQSDPLGKEDEVEGYPNFKTVHHEDWKPITGEQAWAAIIGPLQVAQIKYSGRIPRYCPEMRLACSILHAVHMMQSPTGGFYHAPEGTHGKNPHDISTENNLSMYAALRMLHAAVEKTDADTDVLVMDLLRNQQLYFDRYAFDRDEGIFFQGGFYSEGVFIPTKIFAVDCQVWGIASLGVEWIDRHFGDGTAYHIWKNTVRRGGYFDENGVLRGVGFTDDHRVMTVEWTCGAILATRLMARAYEKTHPEWAKECRENTRTMREGVESMKQTLSDGTVAYLYCNRRYFIPFGWWANPIPSLVASSWVLLTDLHFDPFELGGGAQKPLFS